MEEKHQLHLGYAKAADGKEPKKAVGYSGRMVRFRVLPSDEVQHVKDQCWRDVEEETKGGQLEEKIASMGTEQMIVEVTEPVSPAKAHEAKWTKLSPEQVHNQRSALFSTKDWEVLKSVYLRWHHVGAKEIEDIMGGIVGVVD